MKFMEAFLTTSLVLCLATNQLLQASSSSSSCKSRRSSRADYVVVGVGTAGALMAKRLSDDLQTSVIALQVGENLSKDPEIKFTRNIVSTVITALIENSILGAGSVPGFSLYQTGVTIPQVDANNRNLLWVMALPLGGASSINAGAWCRGTNELFSQWEAIAGPEWSVARVIATYKELEKYNGQTNNPIFRGYNGPLNVRQEATPSNVSLKFTQAMINGTGFPFVVDYNDPTTPIGISSQMQSTQKGPNGEIRVSSNTAFLNKNVMTSRGVGVNGRKLRVLFNSTGLRTIWQGNTAIGVEYERNGVIRRVYANKGVIVSAGLYSSNFLLHSGVGDKAVLNSLNIPVVFDNPNVGQGLADQPHVVLAYESNPDDTSLFFPRGGTFASIAWLPAPGGDPGIRQVRMTNTNGLPGVTIALLDLVQPKSRGKITINSSDPLAPPVIDLGEFINSDDLALFQQSFQTYVKATNNALTAIDPLYKMVFPNPAILDDPVALTEFIKQEVGSNMHFQSHCRMAPFADGGVVDSTGHVYGVQNLIVADDSVVPLCMDGSPMASAYLIAANISRMLIGQ